ncbi:MAG: hypothetical protein LIR22_06715, partial [Bacillota bacterium]|nr:hypothetical protein [Bacillota bacterium]
MKKLLETDAASNSSKIGTIYPILGISVDRLSVVGTAPDDQWVNDFRYMDTPMLKGLRGKLRFPLHLTDKTRAFELQ